MSATHVGSAWSCTVRLVVEDDRVLAAATADLYGLLERVDAAASRFRADSALSRASARAGRPTPVPRLLAELVGAALDAAAYTQGAVDPTLGFAVQRLGYDRDIREIITDGPALDAPPITGRWRAVKLHREAGLLTVPAGTALDLGATAKAWTADRAAAELAARYETAVLVELGGDLAVGGVRPGGWVVRVAEREGADGQLVTLHEGGICTSTTTIREWRRGDRTLHHLLDPRTGEPADGPWRTVTVAAGSALAANTASTAAIVHGAGALEWLDARGTAARLVGRDGAVVTTAGWPAEIEVAA
jgi:thiamine biosynthesis lipoprotein